ncbi:class I SAM-dependent DNA methyltransferase [Novosphingobium rosa]|uniref:class I SAM-dependent DNA methyltransferase n=1 Tax=Novosphingobium rosa TaxID=76978 RepID=UPI000836C0B5|nr:DNA methyltransferase [Novosphingobium rosa]
MRLSWAEIRANAARFSEDWKEKGYEKGQTQTFYDEFFAIFGVPRKQVAVYEQRIKALDSVRTGGFIDLFWPGTLIVEQKSVGRNLTRAMSQALNYYDWLPEVQRPRFVMVCDFQRFELVDLETRREWQFPLADLKRHVEAFGFIIGVQPRLFRNQSPVNRKASELMGRLHNALAADGYTGHNLERLLVRLLFILFADDTGIFERKDMFLTWLEGQTSPDGRDLGAKLGLLFQVLDTPPEKRQHSLDADFAEFPYINGELFRERIDMPAFDNVMRSMLLDASMFNWGEVSPAIFGSLFESVIDSVTRRKQGAHYTPEQAILKVIEPLFLDDLRIEFERLKTLKSGRERALRAFHDRLGALTFLDPACGAGNFLVVAYRELRELERELLKELLTVDGKVELVTDVAMLSQLNVDRFFGIEIDEFPAMIAQVALWMTDHIANTRLAEDFGQHYARIPLVTAPSIRHADALELDWNDVLPAERCHFVFGNPPFVGFVMRGEVQQQQFSRLLASVGMTGKRVDYVAGWFIKAAQYADTRYLVQTGPSSTYTNNSATWTSTTHRLERAASHIRIGFVSTNSITQGEQVSQLWPILFKNGMEISFAHRTFVWPGRAAVHCVIVGMAQRGDEPVKKRLFSYVDGRGEPHETLHQSLTAYLFDAKEADRHLVVRRERTSLCRAPLMRVGTKPVDGGHLVLGPAERAELLAEEPMADQALRPFIGGHEFINGADRWILHLQAMSASAIRQSPALRGRAAAVRRFRQESGGTLALSLADDPTSYHVTVIPEAPFLVIPEVSSERREYIPIGWIEPPTIPSNKLLVVEGAKLWHFAVLTSRIHMSWVRHIGGRLKSDFQYSPGLVYNTFPWPEISPNQRDQIVALAQAVLDARALPKNVTSTLADLYDPDTMPVELRRAHRELDAAVDRLYRRAPFGSDRERVEHLFMLYQRLVDPLQNEGVRQNRRVARWRPKSSPGDEGHEEDD